MAKSLSRIKARKLRSKGFSVRRISANLGIAKSTVSIWCRDVLLTKEQIENLLINKREGIKRGQIVATDNRRRARQKKIEKYKELAYEEILEANNRDFFWAGVALYLGEGSKKDRKLAFTNSNPKLIKFMLSWFEKFFSIKKSRFAFSVIINGIHKNREGVVIKFWQKYLDVSKNQFKKTTFVKSRQNKFYENYNNHYGTIKMRALNGADFFYRINQLTDALLDEGIKIMSA